MLQATRRIKKRKEVKNELSELMNKPDYTLIIHYSCESFYNRPDGSSPRITSIAVRNLGSGQTTSFSIHQMAEIKNYSRADIEKYYEQDFLIGADEATAFEKKEYVKLHQSTLRKVDILCNIMERTDDGSLKTNASLQDIYGSYPEALGEFLKEHWVISLISAVAGIAAVFLAK